MAFYVRLRKVSEDGQAARYDFVSDGGGVGEAVIDKRSGEVKVTKPLATLRGEAAGMRAMATLRNAWRRGTMPETAEWAS